MQPGTQRIHRTIVSVIARNARTTRFCCLGVLGLVLFMPSWAEAQDTAQVGYARLQFDGSSVVPTGSAVFSYRNPQGVLVTEAGVAAVEVLERGRIFVDQAGTRTGLALVNPQTQSSAISFTLRDSAGTIVDSTNLVLEPGNHLARFVDELFSGMPAGFQGSVTFESLAGLGAITLRESQNSNQEPLYTTLPVANLDAVAGSGSLTFPHLAAGGGYLTQVLLINGTSASAEGRIQFIGSDGLPLSLVLDGVATSEVRYELAADGVFSAELEGGAQVEVGYAVLTPEVGSTPSGSVLFEFTTDGQLISAAGVGATDPTTAAKIAIDNVGRQTGFALANPGLVGAEVEIRLQDRFGVTQQEESLTIAAGGHIARFASEFFPTLSAGFNGLIEIESTVPIVSITLQITINSRGDLVLTTLPIADLAAPPISVETVFPQFVIGGGFSTRFVLIATAASGFNLTFHHTDGTPWLVPPTNESTIGFQLGAGQSVRTFPGNTARIGSPGFGEFGVLTDQPEGKGDQKHRWDEYRRQEEQDPAFASVGFARAHCAILRRDRIADCHENVTEFRRQVLECGCLIYKVVQAWEGLIAIGSHLVSHLPSAHSAERTLNNETRHSNWPLHDPRPTSSADRRFSIFSGTP